ncbi:MULTISPECIES: hypothetical protein [Amylolactobacillus]|uniref:Uncharacterized protein n=3 Tax=Amylolactobacillus TaxID=2767876 RepID=A0A1L6XCY2_9LACO|nr:MULTISPECIES: hypothetical protein [Amylolactobacillus]APT18819.1 hypothetical protein LA20533_05900 [Amylolactobacillus amylophilus DSM 20533 = JCM 1125]
MTPLYNLLIESFGIPLAKHSSTIKLAKSVIVQKGTTMSNLIRDIPLYYAKTNFFDDIFIWLKEHVLLLQIVLIALGILTFIVIFTTIIYIRLREHRHRNID